jgi:hypothetical protein
MALVLGMVVASVALLAPARGAFTSLAVAPGQFTGTNRYVPTETMQITITADSGDIYDVQISEQTTCPPYTDGGVVRQTYNNVTIPASGVRSVAYPIPADMPDGSCFYVSVHDSLWYESGNVGATYDTYLFQVRGWTLSVQTDRTDYLPGDNVTLIWSATWIKDGSPAPQGVGEVQAYDFAGGALIPSGRHLFAESQGSTSFLLPDTETPNRIAAAFAWFNDTAGLRETNAVAVFWVRYLGVVASTDRSVYSPEQIVTVSVSAKITDNPGNPSFFDPGAAGAKVNITVVDQSTGTAVTAYSRNDLITDATGDLTYVFQLAATPTSGQYTIDVHAVAAGTNLITADTSIDFTVQQTTAISVTVALDKGQYLSGDTITATATVFRSTPTNYTYTWRATDVDSGRVLVQDAGSSRAFTYATALDYQGTVAIRVTVNDGAGNTATTTVQATVAFGYMSLSLDKAQYNPGDSITATFSLVHGSAVLANPTYYFEVRDAGGATVDSGNVTANSVTYVTPQPASPSYTFAITASQDGRAVQGSATASLRSGFLLQVTPDKASYMPGETIQLSYVIKPQGTSVLPQQFHFTVLLYGGGTMTATATSASGVLNLAIPGDTSAGDLVLFVLESSTGASVIETVHVGATNPLLTEVAGLPVIDWILTLLVIVLILVVFLLWRRTGVGPAPRLPGEGRPTAPPPPAAGPQPPQAAGPMSVTCRHCGKAIEITTSKRPIEVMCPSCGETQVVQ